MTPTQEKTMTDAPTQGDLRIWWIPQVPMAAFRVSVASTDEAVKLLTVLADYDAFQFEHNVKGDYSNVGGLEAFEDGDWSDWYSEDGEDIDDLIRAKAPTKPPHGA